LPILTNVNAALFNAPISSDASCLGRLGTLRRRPTLVCLAHAVTEWFVKFVAGVKDLWVPAANSTPLIFFSSAVRRPAGVRRMHFQCLAGGGLISFRPCR
jgi:hypothetical protein